MVRCTAEERALARAAIYRLLALGFSYPTDEGWAALNAAIEPARVACELTDERTGDALEAFASALGSSSLPELEAANQRVFTLSYAEDCPPYETAFSASHIFQQTQQQADLVGFYRAFGIDPQAERPDHIALELEFCYLVALKEALARERVEPDHVRVCRDAERSFLRDHLARWAPLIGQRVVLSGAGTPYEPLGWLLNAFVAWEERFLRLSSVNRYRDEPVMIADEPGEMSCPLEGIATADPSELPLFEDREEAERVLAIPS